jgi:PAS domain S-box-containing protein
MGVNDRPTPDRREGHERRAADPFHLTPREAEILPFVLRGWGNKDIATHLGLAEQSVKGHISALLHKFAVPNRAALAEAGGRLALTGGIVLDPQWIPQLFRDAEPQISVSRGPDFRIEAVNEAFVKAVGNRPLLGRTAREAFPELEGQGIIEISEQVYATGEPNIRHEAPAKWDRGEGVESRLVDIVVQPLRDETGAVNGIMSFAVDVTDMVRQRRRAALLMEGFATLLELVPSGVILLDDQGTVITLNEAARRITGARETGLIGAQAETLFAGWETADGVPADEPIAGALRGKTIIDATCEFVGGAPSGPVRVRASVRPFRGEDGDVHGAIVEFAELA